MRKRKERERGESERRKQREFREKAGCKTKGRLKEEMDRAMKGGEGRRWESTIQGVKIQVDSNLSYE